MILDGGDGVDVFVGVDLAWTARGRTGLAVVDTSGRLVSSTVAVTDEEIAQASKQVEGKSEMDALIAYLQGLGVELKSAGK